MEAYGKIYGYTRVSSEEQATNTSLASQRSMIEGTAKANELPDDGITWLEDAGISGAKDFMARPAIARTIFRAGDIIIFASLDRFSRDTKNCLETIDYLKNRGVRLIVNGHGDVTDDSNIYGKLMREILMCFASHEREVIRDRVTRGLRAKKRKGGYCGGSTPWLMKKVGSGRDAYLVEDQEEMAKVFDCNWRNASPRTFLLYQMAGKRKIKGWSSRQVADWVWQRYGIQISHVAVIKLTNAYERKQLDGIRKQVADAIRDERNAKRAAAAVKLGMSPKRWQTRGGQ